MESQHDRISRNLHAQKNARITTSSRFPSNEEGKNGDIIILNKTQGGGGVTLLVKSYDKWFPFESSQGADSLPQGVVASSEPGIASLPLLPSDWQSDNESATAGSGKIFTVDAANETATVDIGFGVSLGKDDSGNFNRKGITCDTLIPQGWEAYAIHIHSAGTDWTGSPVSDGTAAHRDLYAWKVSMSGLGYGVNLSPGYDRMRTNLLEPLTPTQCLEDEYIHVSVELSRINGVMFSALNPAMVHGGFIKIRKVQ